MLRNDKRQPVESPCGWRSDASQGPDGAHREGAELMIQREINGRERATCTCSPGCPCQLNSLRAEDAIVFTLKGTHAHFVHPHMTQSGGVG
jgi:hypothetical protein